MSRSFIQRLENGKIINIAKMSINLYYHENTAKEAAA